MSKKKRDWKYLLSWYTIIKFAGFIGLLGSNYILTTIENLTFLDFIIALFIFVLSIPLHVVLHEVGHLIGGLVSGYDFILFRLFNHVWIQTEHGLSKRKQYVQGILGQALMVPPEGIEKPPFLLYHSSGLIMNALTALLFISIGYNISHQSLTLFLYVSAIAALLLFVINLTPSKGNDGYNILQQFKRKESQQEMTSILYLYSGMVKGESFTALQRYIDLDSLGEMANPNTVTFMTAKAAAYLEQQQYGRARELYAELWRNRKDLLEAHKPEVFHNYLYTLLLTEPSHPDVATIQETSVYKNFRKIKTGDGLRVYAAEAVFLEDDYAKARSLLAEGYSMIAKAPTIAEEKLEYALYADLHRTIDALEVTML